MRLIADAYKRDDAPSIRNGGKNMSMSIRMRATINALTVVANNLRLLNDAAIIMKETSDTVKSAKAISTAAKKVENFAKKYDLDLEYMKRVYNDNPDPDRFIAAFIGTPEGIEVYKNVKVNTVPSDYDGEAVL